MTALADVEELVARVVEGSVTEDFALEVLAHVGLTADAEHLSHAVESLKAREGLRDGSIDPLTWLDAPPAMGFDSWTFAVNKAEADYAFAVGQLAKAVEVAS